MTTLKRKKTPIHVDFNDLYSRIYPRKKAILDVDTVKHDDVAPGADTTVKFIQPVGAMLTVMVSSEMETNPALGMDELLPFIQTDGGMLIIRSDDEVKDGT